MQNIKASETSNRNKGKDEEDDSKADGDYADIYPALKLFMMAFMMFGHRVNYIESFKPPDEKTKKCLKINILK